MLGEPNAAGASSGPVSMIDGLAAERCVFFVDDDEIEAGTAPDLDAVSAGRPDEGTG
jgi:hypothetical protein